MKCRHPPGWPGALGRARALAREPRGRPSDTLLQPLGHRPQLGVHLAWRAAEDQVADGVARQSDVGEGAQDVYLVVAQRDTRPGGVLDGVLGLPILARNPPNASRQMVAVQPLNIL